MALTDAAIARIKDMILSGELRPGDRLPKESDLAERLGLSRSSLREAVKALTLIKVLDVRQGDGTYVTSLSPALLLDALAFVVDFQPDASVLQFFEVRRILEPAATALAATRMSGLDELRALVDDLDRLDDLDAVVANDLEFHRRIAAGAGNDVLYSLVDALSGPTARARAWRGRTQADALDRTRRQHRAILDAIAAGDPELARSWATVHIAEIEEWLRRTV
ncbi:FadR/GntR family transcriptional regulator [Catenuloplanes sp. NPDC051500]|uniref:FadR/GntR family transcriptional regulator n=1 Tax=Catenuloplanes sp. NPDC051500 TaxID=3363959 RepID=UPI00379610BD